MPGSETIFDASDETLDISILIVPDTSLSEVAGTVDTLRVANRQLGRTGYSWKVVSIDGAPVQLSCGLHLSVQGALSEVRGGDLLIILAAYSVGKTGRPEYVRQVRSAVSRFHFMAAFNAASWLLARAGLLDGARATIHWEDLEDFALAFPTIAVVPDRFVISGRFITSGAAATTVDVLLYLIRCRNGATICDQVAATFLVDMHNGGDPQQRPSYRRTFSDPRVNEALAAIEQDLENPQPLAGIAAGVGLSQRMLEILFRKQVGLSPAAFRREIQLVTARRLIIESSAPISEILVRVGFTSPSAFSRAFRERFGESPSQLRNTRRDRQIPPI